MRALGVILVGVVPSCYSPGYRDCEITCASGSCPSGLICDQGVCRVGGFSEPCSTLDQDASVPDSLVDGLMPDGPTNDVDSDGVLNTADNCPNKSNANQFNEDNDTFGDVCDPCPIGSTTADHADSDQDGVGAGCDPDPNLPNQIELFEGFRATTLPTGAIATPPANWTFPTGTARVSGTSGRASLFWPQPATPVMTTITASIMLEQSGGAGSGVGVAQRFDASNGIVCWRGEGTFGVDEIRLFQFSGGSPNVSDQVSSLPNASQMKLIRTTQQYTCQESTTSTSLPGSSPFMPANPMYGLFSVDVTARFEWVMIVSRTN